MVGSKIITLKIKRKSSYNIVGLRYGGAFWMKMLRLDDL
jgi:hypothetical protein